MTDCLKVLNLVETVQYAGIERYVQWLMSALKDENIQTSLACHPKSNLYSLLNEAQFTTYPIFTDGHVLARLPVLIKLLKKIKPDIIHVHNGNTMLLASLATRSVEIPIVATQHFLSPQSTFYTGIKRKVYGHAHHWVNSKISHFIAISEAVGREMLARHEASIEKITVIPNGIPIPDIEKLRNIETVRNELSMSADTPLIVSIARLEKEKDISSLITAMKSVNKQFPKAVCAIAGEGSLKESLNAQIKEIGVGASVRLLGFRSDALDLVNAANLFVLPSLAEPFGLSILEAMALGKPVIATRAGGPLEIVLDRETGLLVSPRNPKELAEAIIQLLSDQKMAKSMGEAGKARFESHFTADRMAKATLNVYENVLAKTNSNIFVNKNE